jgi:hypothetical protein
MKVLKQLPPSDKALADRDRRANVAATTTTALLLGDPLPGRSALDQKRAVLKDGEAEDDPEF